jgi:zinc transport system substrate-binding protein
MVIICLSVFAGLASAMEARAQDKIPVFVSILPQRYFVEQIGGERVDVQVMVQPGASPHTYEPKPQQMVHLSRARIYFAIGVSFEGLWLKKIAASNPRMMIVDTAEGLSKIPMTGHRHPGEEKAHQRAGQDALGLDPHIWLSPPMVMVQARNILAALQEIDRAHWESYETNFRAFLVRIAALDGDLRGIFAGKRGLQFMVFHPAWGYFALAYGLVQVPVEIEGKDPKPAELRTLIETARSKGIKVIFLQRQFSSRSAEMVAKEIGGEVLLVDPLALNWDENLREVAGKFRAALR